MSIASGATRSSAARTRRHRTRRQTLYPLLAPTCAAPNDTCMPAANSILAEMMELGRLGRGGQRQVPGLADRPRVLRTAAGIISLSLTRSDLRRAERHLHAGDEFHFSGNDGARAVGARRAAAGTGPRRSTAGVAHGGGDVNLSIAAFGISPGDHRRQDGAAKRSEARPRGRIASPADRGSDARLRTHGERHHFGARQRFANYGWLCANYGGGSEPQSDGSRRHSERLRRCDDQRQQCRRGGRRDSLSRGDFQPGARLRQYRSARLGRGQLDHQHGGAAGDRGRSDQQCQRPHPRCRNEDQPARAQRHDRGGARRRRWTGFAVVAQEVKTLAAQTEKATGDITHQIASIEVTTSSVVQGMKAIVGTIAQLDENANEISAAVQEQDAVSREIARSANAAAERTREVSASIAQVSSAAEQDQSGRQSGAQCRQRARGKVGHTPSRSCALSCHSASCLTRSARRLHR